MNPSLPRVYQIGNFELATAQRRLTADGQEVQLGARAIDLLMALIERGGRAMSRDELLQAAWPGLVVEGSNVAVQVFALRKVLGRQVIATVPGRGYRYALPLPRQGQGTATPAQPPVNLPAAQASAPWPALPTALLGRESDLKELDECLTQHRLVTVVGGAGMGKTALSVAWARGAEGSQIRDGVVWIDLSSADASSGVLRFISQSLGIPMPSGPHALQRLVVQIQGVKAVLILDNAEQVSAEVARFAHAVLRSGADIRLLVTSQKALRVDGECVFRLAPLSVPRAPCAPDAAINYGAVALFMEQARLLDKRFMLDEQNVGDVIALCRQLDGVALAIKLAASRVPMLEVQALGLRMGERFTLLESSEPDAPPRQLALRAALDWSHALLDEAERRVLRRLGVFVGGFTLTLATDTCRDDTLDAWAVEDAMERLVDHSWVVIDEGEEPRYRLLESARAYALLKLEEAGEGHSTRQAHAQAMRRLGLQASQDYTETADAPWLATYGPDIDNLRAALDWCVQHDHDLALALVSSSSDLFMASALSQEARERSRACAGFLHDGLPGDVLASYWLVQSRLLFTNDQRAAYEFALKAIDFYRGSGDDRQLYMALGHAAHIAAFNSTEQARKLLGEQLQLEQVDWPPRMRRVRKVVEAFIAMQEGQSERACLAFEECLRLAREAGALRMAASDLSCLAAVYMTRGDVARAIQLGRELVANLGQQHDITRLMALGNLGAALLADSRHVEARPVLVEFFELARRLAGDGFGTYCDLYAQFAATEGRWRTAARLLGFADQTFARMGHRFAIAENIRATVWAGLTSQIQRDELSELVAAGAGLSFDQVCELTLSSVDSAAIGNPAALHDAQALGEALAKPV